MLYFIIIVFIFLKKNYWTCIEICHESVALQLNMFNPFKFSQREILRQWEHEREDECFGLKEGSVLL